MKKLILFVFIAGLACLAGPADNAYARTEGFYIGGGYQQPLMFTWKKQSTFAPDPGSSIRFWPNFGAFIIGGYQFERPDWLELALPISWGMLRLNKTEWVHLINGDAEVIFHFVEPDKKFDPFIGLLAGFNYMTEGSLKDESASIGPDVGASFGFKYTLMEYAVAGSTKVTNLSLLVELPVKVIFFVNDSDLSDSSTTPIIQIPFRVGVTYTF